MSTTDKSVAVLRRWRMKLRCSQERLAELSGISPGYLAALEQGRRSPSVETLRRLRTALIREGASREAR